MNMYVGAYSALLNNDEIAIGINSDQDLQDGDPYFQKNSPSSKLNLFLEEIFEEENNEEESFLLFKLIHALYLDLIEVDNCENHFTEFYSFSEKEPLFITYCSLKIPFLS